VNDPDDCSEEDGESMVDFDAVAVTVVEGSNVAESTDDVRRERGSGSRGELLVKAEVDREARRPPAVLGCEVMKGALVS